MRTHQLVDVENSQLYQVAEWSTWLYKSSVEGE